MKILVIAGPNGAGKTTFARRYLKREGDRRRFVNGDDIAAKLRPDDPAAVAQKAGRLALREMEAYVARGEDFATEATLSGRAYAKTDPALASLGISGFHHLPSGAERRSLRCACRPARSRRRAPHSRDRDPPALRAELEELPRPLPEGCGRLAGVRQFRRGSDSAGGVRGMECSPRAGYEVAAIRPQATNHRFREATNDRAAVEISGRGTIEREHSRRPCPRTEGRHAQGSRIRSQGSGEGSGGSGGRRR